VDVVVGHQEGVDIAVEDLWFEVSYDDGATWREATQRRTGDGSYTVDLGLTPPAADGFVSFRVGAVDAHSNRIQQEIIRAAAVGEG
jgi:hypothetical protein